MRRALLMAWGLAGCGVPAGMAGGDTPPSDAAMVQGDAGGDVPDARTDATEDVTVDVNTVPTDSSPVNEDSTVRHDSGLADGHGGDAGPSGRDAGMDATVGDGGGHCPTEMVLVNGTVCVDRWEASLEEVGMDGGLGPWSPYLSVEGHRVRAVSRPDVVPQGYISGAQAQAACALAGKRLCAVDEWLAACRGPTDRVYPYGNTYVHRRCNEGRMPHPVVEFYGTSVGVFTYANMNNPGINMQANTVSHTGAFTDCVSTWGIYDLVGNMHEWVAAPTGTFKGGYYVDAEINGHGCLYTTTAHAFTYHDYSTGFRCCADPQ